MTHRPAATECERERAAVLRRRSLERILLLRLLDLFERFRSTSSDFEQRGGGLVRAARRGTPGGGSPRSPRRPGSAAGCAPREGTAASSRHRRLVRFANERPDALVPTGLASTCTSSRAARRVRVLCRRSPERARVRRRRFVPLVEIAEHVAELEQLLARDVALGLRLELELQKLLDHVELAEIPVHPARFLERLERAAD